MREWVCGCGVGGWCGWWWVVHVVGGVSGQVGMWRCGWTGECVDVGVGR